MDTYPDWLGIVLAATPALPDRADEGPAWFVDVGARLGPLRRSKRVRMVRVEDDPPSAVRFARRETDGRQHSPWVLVASLAPAGDGCELEMSLHYGGSGWLPVVDSILAAEIRRAAGRLARRVT